MKIKIFLNIPPKNPFALKKHILNIFHHSKNNKISAKATKVLQHMSINKN
jgi:hypothetical protein